MNGPETTTTKNETEPESQQQLREWVTPSFEEFPLKEALGGTTTKFLKTDSPRRSS